MSKIVREFYFSFLAAWQKLFCINLPERWYPRNLSMDSRPVHLRTMLPAAGAVPGILAVFAIWLVSELTNLGGAILFAAFLLPPVWESLTKWAGFRAAGYYIHLFCNGLSAQEIMDADWNSDDLKENSDAVSQIVLFSFYLLQMSLCGILVYYGKSVWFVYAWIGSAFLQAGLSRYCMDDNGEPLLEEPAASAGWFYGSSAILFFITGGISGTLPSAVWCFVGSWVLQVLFSSVAKVKEKGISPLKLALFGDCARLLLMILGIAVFR